MTAKSKVVVGQPSPSAIEDHWQRQATIAAITAARKVIGMDGAIASNTPVGRLSDVEWGWLVAAILFAWIAKRAEQATAEGLDTELVIRTTGLDPNPWDAGAVATILPKLIDVPDVDWSKPLADWPRESMVAFLTAALNLIRASIIARDLGGGAIIRKAGADKLNDPVPSF
jgi:hypothetical protein